MCATRDQEKNKGEASPLHLEECVENLDLAEVHRHDDHQQAIIADGPEHCGR